MQFACSSQWYNMQTCATLGNFQGKLTYYTCSIMVANNRTQWYWHALVMTGWPVCVLMLTLQVMSIPSTLYNMHQ